jgi:CRP/FNR family transcriptional regulator
MMCRLCLKEWHPAIQANHKNFAIYKGDPLFREGEEMKGIYFVYSGLFKVHKQWEADKELIVRFAGSGDIIGHRGLGKDEVYPVSATALEASIVCYFDLEFFLCTLKVNTEFMYNLMMFYAAELKESEKNMRNLAHMQVKGRIAQALLNLREKFGTNQANNINIAISRQEFASYVGTSYESLFRLLNEFAEENILSLDGKKIAIVNEKELAKYLSDDPKKNLIS